ncbi:NRDE family protein [Halalkalibacter alkaliphilus]|uniref:NRDE family protein n=1 Tax=Halalkalibacter alkaliphilus TaxID=2917993 RepID=A0A9X2A612_9BACI|nr:NRDE family protein [Halalkalibacter alkaliphilus]MCL7745981.1 NRDE family protein [Halalkalibacter alkaliphilus]
MCLLAIGLHVHSEYDVVLVSNRDEFFNRATERAHLWTGDTAVVAGRDLEKGGTWLGVTKSGRLAAVTNVREQRSVEGMKSRGALVTDFLLHNDEPEAYVRKVLQEKDLYQGFNLITGEGDQWLYSSNRADSERLESGLHVVSNAQLNTDWPKARKLKEKLSDVFLESMNEECLIERCMDILKDERLFHDDQLPSTGVPIEIERMLSPIFIKGFNYGTRASTVILFSKKGFIRFIEQGYGPNGKSLDKVDMLFET